MPGGPGSVRARLRLAAVVVLGLLVAGAAFLCVRFLLFAPAALGGFSTVLSLFFGSAAVAYGLLARAVVRQSRVGHLLALGGCGLGALLSVSPGMTWPDWMVLVLNLVAIALLLACIPRRRAA